MELPTLGKVGEKHPPDLQQGDKGLPAGRCHQNLGEKKAPSLGWEMPPAAVPMAMLQGGMLVATGDGAAVGRAELEEPGALGKRWGFT